MILDVSLPATMNIGETWPSIVDHPLHCAMCLVHKILNIGETHPSNSGHPMHNINILLCCTNILNIGQCWPYCAADHHHHKLYWLYFLYMLISVNIDTIAWSIAFDSLKH